MKFDLDSIKKILVIRYRSIGDILLSNPTLAALRHRFPGASIHFLVDDIFVEILANNPNMDKIVINPRRSKGMGLKHEITRIRELRKGKYDIVVDLQTGPRGAFTTALTGAPIRAGHPFRLRNRLCYNLHAESPDPLDHSWRVQFLTIRPLGIEWPETPEFFLDIPEDKSESMKRRLEDAGLMFDRPTVTLHPGARVDTKRWPSARMGILARWLVDEMGAAVILAGSEADVQEIHSIRKASGYALPYFTDLSLGELGALLVRSSLLVCNDSGPMHMAGALGVPLVALFGPSDPSIWAPVGADKIIITPDPMECMPCDQKGCPHKGDHCMTRIDIKEVKDAVKRLWGRA